MNYKKWMINAKRRIEALSWLDGDIRLTLESGPCYLSHEIDQIALTCPLGIPLVLRRFMKGAASYLNYFYWWKPFEDSEMSCELMKIFSNRSFIWGGPRFLIDSRGRPDIAYLQESRLGWVAYIEGDDDISIKERDLWENTVPFSSLGNGDLLSLDMRCNSINPPVVYLRLSEPGSRIISPSFTSFLNSWEKMYYIGPEDWLMFFGKDGLINSEHENSLLLGKLLCGQ